MTKFQEDINHIIKDNDLVPCGLRNVSNTCYVNSLFQSYFTIEAFRKKVLECVIPDTNNLPNDLQVLYQLQLLFCSMLQMKNKTVNPKKLVKLILEEESGTMDFGRQNDITEFEDKFCDKIERGINYLRKTQNKKKLESKTYDQKPYLKKGNSKNDNQSQFKIEQGNESVNEKGNWIKDFFFSKQKNRDTEMENKKKKKKKEKIQKNANKRLFPDPIESQFFLTLPKVLIFHLGRVLYDVRSQQRYKNSDKFIFGKKLYLDKYLEKNRSNKLKSKKIKDGLKKKNKLFIEQLKGINNNYENSEISLKNSFQNGIAYLKNKKETEHMKEIIKLHNLMHKKEQKCITHMNENNNQINKIEPIKKCEYQLHSLLMHSGSADFGHYWSYINDAKNKCWWEFNDARVQQISEKKVMKYAQGGNGISVSAYCLIYLYSEIKNQDLIGSIQQDQKLIPEQIQKYLKTENDRNDNYSIESDSSENKFTENYDSDSTDDNENYNYTIKNQYTKKMDEKNNNKEIIYSIKLKILDIFNNKKYKIDEGNRIYSVKNLETYCINFQKTDVVKYIIMEEFLSKYFDKKTTNLTKKKKKKINLMNYDSDNSSEEYFEFDSTNDIISTFLTKLKDDENKKQKFKFKLMKLLNMDNTIDYQTEIEILKFQYLTYLIYNEELLSAIKNFNEYRYYTSLLQMFDLKKKIKKSNLELSDAIKLNNYINKCSTKLLITNFKYIKNAKVERKNKKKKKKIIKKISEIKKTLNIVIHMLREKQKTPIKFHSYFYELDQKQNNQKKYFSVFKKNIKKFSKLYPSSKYKNINKSLSELKIYASSPQKFSNHIYYKIEPSYYHDPPKNLYRGLKKNLKSFDYQKKKKLNVFSTDFICY
ncbi:ubiquitin carboxyl-terminal hydrolase [Anaeramoeba flamelloides]|uniref:ubiquitinyl hydrolase 1 n=1 Tax=Anaeramoeba flamelloides TaxID=1746091 RepID=A0AAV7Y7L5_9EUKA|nr:ubiquitin carboxyl-terminal hydrolase [Anaeramoeba flamelloides]